MTKRPRQTPYDKQARAILRAFRRNWFTTYGGTKDSEGHAIPTPCQWALDNCERLLSLALEQGLPVEPNTPVLPDTRGGVGIVFRDPPFSSIGILNDFRVVVSFLSAGGQFGNDAECLLEWPAIRLNEERTAYQSLLDQWRRHPLNPQRLLLYP